MLIRQLIADSDLVTVHEFYALAPDYWHLSEGQEPGLQKARDFFKDTSTELRPKDLPPVGPISG